MNPSKEAQLKAFNKLAKTALVWLQSGAKGQKFGFNMENYCIKWEAIDYKNRPKDMTVCIFGAIAIFSNDMENCTSRQITNHAFNEIVENKKFNELKLGKLALPTDMCLTRIKPKHAARVLEYFMKTGEVDWAK